MRIIHQILTFIDSINIWVAKIISPLILAAVIIIVYEVFMRVIYNSPTMWVHELSQMLFGAFFMLAGGYVLYVDKHVRVDILISRLSIRTNAIISIATSVLFFSYVGSLLYYGFDRAWHAFLRGEYSDTPWGPIVWPVLFMIPLGALLILLQGFAKLIRNFVAAVTGREA
jgi:TRAP-type mannitol/chloroaromatic compound transport system permease small subunit